MPNLLRTKIPRICLQLLVSSSRRPLSPSRVIPHQKAGFSFFSFSSSFIMPAEVDRQVSDNKRSLSTSPLKSSPVKKVKVDDMTPTPTPVAETEMKTEGNGMEVEVDVAEMKTKVLAAEPSTPKLFFAKLSDKAHIPTRGSKVAAGYDLKSAYKYTVPARGSCLVKTDIQIKLPSGFYGRVAPRSGLALKNKIDVGAGVIDEDYRGNVGVILFNFSDVDFEVNEGDRVAQLICEKICYPDLVELETLDETERGEGGFGSTGVSSDEPKSA